MSLAAAVLPLPALAQTNAALMPMPKLQFFDAKGALLAGGLIYTYAAGTTTPLATYTDTSGTVANPNPMVLDAGGFASIRLRRDCEAVPDLSGSLPDLCPETDLG